MTAPTPEKIEALGYAASENIERGYPQVPLASNEDTLWLVNALGSLTAERDQAEVAYQSDMDEMRTELNRAISDFDEERAQHGATKSTLDDAWEKLHVARQIITAAPHGPHCSSLIPVPDPPRYPCNCWKKELS